MHDRVREKNIINLNSDDEEEVYVDLLCEKDKNEPDKYSCLNDLDDAEANITVKIETGDNKDTTTTTTNNNNIYVPSNIDKIGNTIQSENGTLNNNISNSNIHLYDESISKDAGGNSSENNFVNNDISKNNKIGERKYPCEIKDKSCYDIKEPAEEKMDTNHISNNACLNFPIDKNYIDLENIDENPYSNDNITDTLKNNNVDDDNNINEMNNNNIKEITAKSVNEKCNTTLPNDISNNIDMDSNMQDNVSNEINNDSINSNNTLLNICTKQTKKKKKKNQKTKIIKKCGGLPDKEEPILPFYVICDYLDFVERKIYVSKFRFKLYDPIYQLGKYRNCAGVILKKDLKKSCLNYIDSHFLFLKKELCKIDLDIDIRCPTKQIFKHVCYKMNVDPTHILIFPYPPLNSPVNFSPYNIDSFTCHSDSDYENYQKNNNSCYGQTPFETLIKQHSMALEHNSLTEQKTFCLSLLPFHYKYFTRLYPSEAPKYFHYVVQLFNSHVQSVAAYSGHIKFKKSLDNDAKSNDFYDRDDSYSDYSSSNSDNSNSTIINNEYIPNNYTTVQDLIDKIKLEINPYLKKRGIDVKQKFRLLFTFGPKIKYLSSNEQLIEMDFVKTNHIKNIYVTPLRMEPDFTDEQKRLIETDQLKIIHVFNQTPSKEVFGYNFDVLVDPNDNMLDIKNKIRKRTLLPKYIFDKITFFEFENGQRIWRSNDDTINWKNKQFAIIIGEHHAPSHSKPQMGMKIA